MRLRRRQRLRRQADFTAVRKEGRRHFGAAFVLSIRTRTVAGEEGGRDLPRFAPVASRRVGPAVVRNRVKRRLREIFRQHQDIFPSNVDIIASTRPRAANSSYAELERQFLAAAKRLGYPAGRGRRAAGDAG